MPKEAMLLKLLGDAALRGVSEKIDHWTLESQLHGSRELVYKAQRWFLAV
jgi:hypothetical protein